MALATKFGVSREILQLGANKISLMIMGESGSLRDLLSKKKRSRLLKNRSKANSFIKELSRSLLKETKLKLWVVQEVSKKWQITMLLSKESSK
jgi:hypothetical protein